MLACGYDALRCSVTEEVGTDICNICRGLLGARLHTLAHGRGMDMHMQHLPGAGVRKHICDICCGFLEARLHTLEHRARASAVGGTVAHSRTRQGRGHSFATFAAGRRADVQLQHLVAAVVNVLSKLALPCLRLLSAT